MLTASGSVYAIGESLLPGSELQSGQYIIEQFKSPILAMESGAKSISSGYSYSLILKEDGSLWAFGDNERGQLGDGTFISRTMPTMVIPNGVVSVKAGLWHSLVLKEDGSVWGFGFNEYGQLGIGSTEDQPDPVMIFPAGIKFISAGRSQSHFIKTDGSLWTAGRRNLNFMGESNDDPTLLVQLLDSGATLASGDGFQTIVQKDDGTTWAYNEVYPNGYYIDEFSREVTAIHTEALKTYLQFEDGSLYESNGFFGEGLFEAYASFHSWFGSSVSEFSASPEFRLILRTDGSVWLQEYFNTPAEQIVGETRRLPNSPPVADAGQNIVAYDTENIGYTDVILDATQSTDNWQIASWKWEWPGNTYTGNYQIHQASFPRGETTVKLTVQDNEGLSSTHEIRVTVLEFIEFDAWLTQYFSLSEIDAMGTDAKSADPDNDGISNEEEKRMGLNPRVRFDPFSQRSLYFVIKNDGPRFRIYPYGKELIYNLWGSSNLKDWKIQSYPKIELEDRIEYVIPETETHYYKVQISDPQGP